MQSYIAELRRLIESSHPRLAAMPDAVNARRHSPGKWSPREIIGHLIDSASVNHQRFVRARFQPDLVFPGYDQDAWVAAQRYQDAPWDELLALWRSYNLRLARVMESTPADLRRRRTTEHNFHEIGWKAVRAGDPASLDDLMADYVGHLAHHLRQVLPDGA